MRGLEGQNVGRRLQLVDLIEKMIAAAPVSHVWRAHVGLPTMLRLAWRTACWLREVPVLSCAASWATRR